MKDQALFNLWSQHKPKNFTLEKHYIKGKLDKAIEYLAKIQDIALIDNVESYIREIENYKTGMNEINNLKDLVSTLLEVINPHRALEFLKSDLEKLNNTTDDMLLNEITDEYIRNELNLKDTDIITKETKKPFLKNKKNELELDIEDIKQDIIKHESLISKINK